MANLSDGITLGPITLVSSKTRTAYRELANAAYDLHQHIWFADDLGNPETQEMLRAFDQLLAFALSNTPASDIDSE